MDYRSALALIRRAEEQEQADREWLQWAIQLPTMAMAGEYVSLKDYRDRLHGANIDTRPTGEILAELDELEKEFTKGGVEYVPGNI